MNISLSIIIIFYYILCFLPSVDSYNPDGIQKLTENVKVGTTCAVDAVSSCRAVDSIVSYLIAFIFIIVIIVTFTVMITLDNSKQQQKSHWHVNMLKQLMLAVWLTGNTLASINVVALRQTRLVLKRVTVCGRVNHFGM